MQGKKKSLVNILSYKYKQEYLKMFPSIMQKNYIANKYEDRSHNLCPGGRQCQNYIIICQLENQIKILNDTIVHLKRINELTDVKYEKIENIPKHSNSLKYEKNNELFNSFRKSSMKRSQSNKIVYNFDSSSLNDSLKSALSNVRLNTTNNFNSSTISSSNFDKNNDSEKEMKIRDIFQSIKIKNRNLRYENNDISETKSINSDFHENKRLFRRNNSNESNNDGGTLSEIKKKKSTAIKIISHKNSILKKIEINDVNKDQVKNQDDKPIKLKINNFSNLLPIFQSQKPVIKFNPTNDNLNRAKTCQNTNLDNNNINLIENNEFNNFIKDYERYSNYSIGNIIYNDLYNLTSPTDKTLLKNIKELNDEQIYKYCSMINYSLKYLKNISLFVQKIKNYFCNRNKKNISHQNRFFQLLHNNNNNNLKEEFLRYKEEVKKLLNCEKLNIFIYDSNLDCLILKEENNELKYPKDKDLIGLCFTSSKKIRHDSENNKSEILSNTMKEQKLNFTINNLLIFPLKDKDGIVYGVIEAINKIKEEKNNKAYFDRNDEFLLDLMSKNIGNFCKYFNIIENKNNYISYYHDLLNFWNKLFFKTSISGSLFLVLEEFSKLMKNVFDTNQVQFLLNINQSLFDIQKSKIIECTGIVYKCLQEKKIIYCSNPLKNKNYHIATDLPITNKFNSIDEELITFPVFYGDNKNQDVGIIIQMKNKRRYCPWEMNTNNTNVVSYLNQEKKFIIDYVAFLIQKYLNEHKELIKNYSNLCF